MEVYPPLDMRTHIEFRSTNPILLYGRKRFAGMEVSNYHCVFDDTTNRFVEKCDLSNEYGDWTIPTLLATIAGDMKYWKDYSDVKSVSELHNLIAATISKYTSDDMSKCIEWDDFDDYLVMLQIALDEIVNGKVNDDLLRYFIHLDDEVESLLMTPSEWVD